MPAADNPRVNIVFFNVENKVDQYFGDMFYRDIYREELARMLRGSFAGFVSAPRAAQKGMADFWIPAHQFTNSLAANQLTKVWS